MMTSFLTAASIQIAQVLQPGLDLLGFLFGIDGLGLRSRVRRPAPAEADRVGGQELRIEEWLGSKAKYPRNLFK